MKLTDIKTLSEAVDKEIIKAGKKALKIFHQKLDAQDIKGFEEMYMAASNGQADGWVDKILYDAKTGDFYIQFTMTVSFDEEEGEDDAEDDAEDTVFCKVTKSGVLSEINKMPTEKSFIDVSKSETDFNS